jgi:CheY-like chemotaxis protein
MKRILVIEDNLMIRENAMEMLELAGYHVTTAPDGVAGIEIARQHAFDAYLCDVMMPGASGHEVFETLKRENIIGSKPFIFISASVERRAVDEALNKGVTAYIRKPFEEQVLLDTLQQVLGAGL